MNVKMQKLYLMLRVWLNFLQEAHTQSVLALRDQFKSGSLAVTHTKYVDKKSVGMSPKAYCILVI